MTARYSLPVRYRLARHWDEYRSVYYGGVAAFVVLVLSVVAAYLIGLLIGGLS